MLPLEDIRWSGMNGAYRVSYDPRPAFARLRMGDDSVWDELWQELHHQGDVDIASYAAVPHLVAIHKERGAPAWQMFALIGTIELCRTRRRNPSPPDWLEQSYWAAWGEVQALGCRDLSRTNDETTVQAILSAIAIAKGLRTVGEIILDNSEEELRELIDAR